MPAFGRLALLVAAVAISLATDTASADQLPVVRAQQKISATSGGFPGTLTEFTSFGWGLASLGDPDEDGAVEIVVGAHFDDDGAKRAGAIWIVELAPDGTVGSAHKISALAGGFRGPLETNDAFGLGIARLGDLDGDDIPEVAVSAPGDDDGGPDSGAIYILYFDRDLQLRRRVKISGRAAWTRAAPWRWILPESVHGGFAGEPRPGDMLGASLEAIGDLDGDGVPDLAAGLRAQNPEGALRGGLWILFLRADGTVKRERRIDPADLGIDIENEDAFGLSLGALGDIDSDGIQDLAVGAIGDDDGGDARGALYLLSLERDGGVRRVRKISSTNGGFVGPLRDGAEFGVSVTALPDFDGNGVADLAVGARGDDAAGPFTGAIWLLSIDREGGVVAQRMIGAGEGGLPPVLRADDVFGTGLVVVGDLDGDGWPELAAGAEGDDDGGKNSGAVWNLFLGAP